MKRGQVVSTQRNQTSVIVFPPIGDPRSETFLEPLSKLCASQPGVRMLAFTYLTERDSLEAQKERF